MSLAPNPIMTGHPARVQLSEHARFRMEEHDVDQQLIQRLIAAPSVDYRVDPKSGHYVFSSGRYRVVMRKSQDESFLVLAVFDEDQMPI